MRKTAIASAVGCVGLLSAAVPVQATLITTASAGTTTVLTTIAGGLGIAPSVVAGGYTVSAPSGSDVWYGDVFFALAENGIWGDPPFAWVGGRCEAAGCNPATIDLGGSYSAVGGFMNYADTVESAPFGPGSPTIWAIAADGTTILESYDLSLWAPITTGLGSVNDGAFRGISRGTADIAYFRISGSYLIMHDLTVGEAAVPEPSTLLLLGAGLLAGGRRLRSRRQ